MAINNVVTESFPDAKLLASGFYGSVYALSESTVVKAVDTCIYWFTATSCEPADVLAFNWANTLNNLVVKHQDYIPVNREDGESLGHLFFMERVFPCVPTAFSREELQAAVEVAEAQLNELWESGWAHCDLKRPDFIKRAYNKQDDDILFNNIALTEVDGKCVIRLIDLGNANLEQYDEEDKILKDIAKDKEDWRHFKEWLLNYPRQH